MVIRALPVFSPILLACLALPVQALAQEAEHGKEKPQTRPAKAEEDWKPPAALAEALGKAQRQHKRIILLFNGGDSAASQIFKRDRRLSRLLLYEFELVDLPVGEEAAALGGRFGVKQSLGEAKIMVLSAAGKGLIGSRMAEFKGEKGGGYDASKVMAFLANWQVEPQDAEVFLAKAMATARQENKRVLVHLGAPW